MNPIDKIFKKGLSKKGRPYSADQWAEMEGLLASKSKTWMTGLLWFLGSITAVVLALIFLWPSGVEHSEIAERSNVDAGQKLSEPVVGNQAEIEDFIRGKADKSVQGETDAQQLANAMDIVETGSGGAIPIQEVVSLEEEQIEVLQNDIDELAIKNTDTISRIGDFEDLKSNNVRKERQHVQYQNLDLLPILDLTLRNDLDVSFRRLLPGELTSPKPWRLFLAPHVDHVMNQRSFNVTNVLEYKNTETTANSLGLGLDFLLKRKKWVIKTGLERRGFKEKTNYVVTSNQWTYDTSLVLVKREFVKTPRGAYVALVKNRIDSTAADPISTVNCPDCEVSFKYLHVPLAIQREFSFTNRWMCFVEIGGNASFLTSANGSYVVSDVVNAGPEVIEELDASYLNPVVYGINASVGVKHRVSSRLNAYLRYGYGTSLNSMMKNYDQRYDLQRIGFGLEVGLF